MLYCIVGETSRGKDTFANYLKEKYGLKAVCSYTTRVPRIGETQGVEHHFISKMEAQIILDYKKDEIAAYTEIGNIQYFALTEDLKSADIYIIDPNGIEYLKDKYKDSLDLCVIYITCPEILCRQRALKRGDLSDVLDKRIKSESLQFKQFADNEGYNYRYDNVGTLEDLYEFADKVMKETGKIKNNS